MTTTTDANKQRAAAAADLTRIAMRLQRAPAAKQAALLRNADRALANYKLARNVLADAPNPNINPTVEADLEGSMQGLAEALQEMLRPLGWALFVFKPDTDMMNYISNCSRDDIVAAVEEFAMKHRANAAEPEGKQ